MAGGRSGELPGISTVTYVFVYSPGAAPPGPGPAPAPHAPHAPLPGPKRKLYSAVPGRRFIVVQSYAPQGDGEIQLNRGEAVKGECGAHPRAPGRAGWVDRAVPGWAQAAGPCHVGLSLHRHPAGTGVPCRAVARPRTWGFSGSQEHSPARPASFHPLPTPLLSSPPPGAGLPQPALSTSPRPLPVSSPAEVPGMGMSVDSGEVGCVAGGCQLPAPLQGSCCFRGETG